MLALVAVRRTARVKRVARPKPRSASISHRDLPRVPAFSSTPVPKRLPPNQPFRTSVVCTASVYEFHAPEAAQRLDDLLEILNQPEAAVGDATPNGRLSAGVRRVLLGNQPAQAEHPVIEARATSVDEPAATKEEYDADA